jgi:GDP-D-mannose dehydratase
MEDVRKTALIPGIMGQEGAYLAELLLGKACMVQGVKRRSSPFNADRIDHLYQGPHVDDQRLVLHYGGKTGSSFNRVVVATLVAADAPAPAGCASTQNLRAPRRVARRVVA